MALCRYLTVSLPPGDYELMAGNAKMEMHLMAGDQQYVRLGPKRRNRLTAVDSSEGIAEMSYLVKVDLKHIRARWLSSIK